MRIPPGWAHEVVNKRACGKIAWDYLDESQLALYAWVHQVIFTNHSKTFEPGEDYMKVMTILIVQACQTGKLVVTILQHGSRLVNQNSHDFHEILSRFKGLAVVSEDNPVHPSIESQLGTIQIVPGYLTTGPLVATS